MRCLWVLFLISIPFICLAKDTKQLSQCYEKAFTQKELNQCAGIDYRTADAELNRVYKLIRKVYKDDPKFLNKMKIAQRAWIKFRDAQFAMMFPHEDDAAYYGSAFPMCAGNYKASLTLQRVLELKQWLKGAEEGDVCSGSVKRPYAIQSIIKQK